MVLQQMMCVSTSACRMCVRLYNGIVDVEHLLDSQHSNLSSYF